MSFFRFGCCCPDCFILSAPDKELLRCSAALLQGFRYAALPDHAASQRRGSLMWSRSAQTIRIELSSALSIRAKSPSRSRPRPLRAAAAPAPSGQSIAGLQQISQQHSHRSGYLRARNPASFPISSMHFRSVGLMFNADVEHLGGMIGNTLRCTCRVDHVRKRSRRDGKYRMIWGRPIGTSGRTHLSASCTKRAAKAVIENADENSADGFAERICVSGYAGTRDSG